MARSSRPLELIHSPDAVFASLWLLIGNATVRWCYAVSVPVACLGLLWFDRTRAGFADVL